MSSNTFNQPYKITKANREQLHGHKSYLIWFTGLSGSGKSTLANLVENELYNKGFSTYTLDGDNIRKGINKNLSFSSEDRSENIRRISEIANLMIDAGILTLAAFVSLTSRIAKELRILLVLTILLRYTLTQVWRNAKKEMLKDFIKKLEAEKFKT